MNVWFGIQPWAAVCYELEQVPTPVGEDCQWCHEPIALEDAGWGVGGDTGDWFHAECVTRMLVGSVGHQLGVCACKGGEYEDPPTLTRREAAKAAFEQAQATAAQQQPYIVCPRCGVVSHNPKDVSERYCGRCHRFHDDA